MSERPILIDTDPGIDDAVALALAARLKALRVVCITTVYGNTEVAYATRNAREIALRTGLHAPVVAGAAHPLTRPARPARETHGEQGLGHFVPGTRPIEEKEGAADAIADAARLHPPLTLCCLGPLTNLAIALKRAPTLSERLGPVFVMGGALDVRGTQTRWSEFNWWADPEAADSVLRAGLDLRLVPLDVTRRIAIPGAAIRALCKAAERDADARLWAEALRYYADFHRRWERFDGAIVNDPLAIALASDPSLARWQALRVVVSCSEDERRGAMVRSDDQGYAVRVALEVQARKAIALIGERVFGRWVTVELFDEGASAAERWLAENPLHKESL